jgi:hypothetical protein
MQAGGPPHVALALQLAAVALDGHQLRLRPCLPPVPP